MHPAPYRASVDDMTVVTIFLHKKYSTSFLPTEIHLSENEVVPLGECSSNMLMHR